MDFAVVHLTTEPMPSLLAVLGLLLSWELHDLEVQAGRILPRDIAIKVRRWAQRNWAVRLYIHATPNDATACAACQIAHGRVFSHQAVFTGGARAFTCECTNPAGCRCVLIGLVGTWPEGEQLYDRTQDALEPIRLSELEITQVLRSAQDSDAVGTGDRLALDMLTALHFEGVYPPLSISYYSLLITAEKTGQRHPYIVETYLRLGELLERSGHLTAALRVVKEFRLRVLGNRIRAVTPVQVQVMWSRERRLRRVVAVDHVVGEETS